MQGFTQLHFTPLEVLAIIEGVKKRLDKKFTTEEIERGVLKDILIDDDYDLVRVVSFSVKFLCRGYRVTITFKCSISNDSLSIAFECGEIALTNQPNYNLFFQKKDLREDRRRVLSDEAKRLFRAEPGLLSAAENEFKSKTFTKIQSSSSVYFLDCVIAQL